MHVLGVPFQCFLEITLGGDVIALGQIGDAEFGLVIDLERARRLEGIIKEIYLQETAGAQTGGVSTTDAIRLICPKTPPLTPELPQTTRSSSYH